jgi:hypothetical protein
MLDCEKMNANIKEVANKIFSENMDTIFLYTHFKCMKPRDIRTLLGWSDNLDLWIPQEYPEDTVEYRLIAACMLRYYYNIYPSSITWETADGLETEVEVNQEIISEKKYWENILANNSISA